MMWLLLLIQVAVAEILILSPTLSQEDARELSEECLSILAGKKELEVRISRFFVKGVGYQYRVVVAGFSDEDQAAELYEQLTVAESGFSLQLETQSFNVEKRKKDTTSTPEDPPIEPRTSSSTEESHSDADADKKRFRDRLIPTSTDVLSHAQEAHENVQRDWDESEREHFEFTRRLPQDGVIVKHSFFRLKEAMRLEITVEKGSGVNSTTVLPDEGEGWVQSEEKLVSRNAIRTKELLERFSSQNILSIPFHFSTDVQTASPWRDFNTVEDGGDIWLLISKNSTGLVEASFHKTTWLLNHIKVVEGSNSIEYEFQDYRENGTSGKVPHLVQIYNDGILTEEIQIDRLDLNPDLSEDLFSKKN